MLAFSYSVANSSLAQVLVLAKCLAGLVPVRIFCCASRIPATAGKLLKVEHTF